MAFGIDDALTTAAAGISLTDTIVEIIKRYNKKDLDADFEVLLEEVRVSAIKKIDEADMALSQFERMLLDRSVDINQRLSDVIAATPFWNAMEQRKLSQIRQRFNEFADSIYSAGDDIAALARCRNDKKEMGISVVESTRDKHRLHMELLNAKSFKEAIELLRSQLAKYKATLLDSTPRPRGRGRVAAA
jgi:hypothetical protein